MDPTPAGNRKHRILAVASTVALVAALLLNVHAAKELEDATAAELRAKELEARARVPAAPNLSNQQIVDLFHQLYFNSRNYLQTSWLGVLARQNPPDMWVLQELVTEVRPDFIIDSGTFHGGSAMYFATLLEILGGPSKVLTIDIEPHTAEAEQHAVFRKRVEVFTGSSTDEKIAAQIRERTKGKRVLVLLDSDHRRDHVLRELETYAPMVSPGSYLVVQDTNLNGHPVPGGGPGPWEAVHEYVAKHPEFVIDKSKEKFLLTFTPSGYLKKGRLTAQGVP